MFELAGPSGRGSSTGRCTSSRCRSGRAASCAVRTPTPSSSRVRTRPGSSLLGRCSPGVRAPVILDVHGDWRSSTRLYGSPARRLLNPIADRVAVSALRRADAVRTISDYTTGLVRSARRRAGGGLPGVHATSSRSSGRARPLPRRRAPCSSACSSTYKGIDELAEAWRIVARAGARRDAPPRRTRHAPGGGRAAGRRAARPDRVDGGASHGGGRARAGRGDRARPPVADEGMGRVLVEAFCARPAGGRRPRVRAGSSTSSRDGENGLLVDAARPGGPGRRAAPRPLGTRRSPSGWRPAPPPARADLGGHAGGVRGAAGGAGRGTTIGACVPTASSRR